MWAASPGGLMDQGEAHAGTRSLSFLPEMPRARAMRMRRWARGEVLTVVGRAQAAIYEEEGKATRERVTYPRPHGRAKATRGRATYPRRKAWDTRGQTKTTRERATMEWSKARTQAATVQKVSSSSSTGPAKAGTPKSPAAPTTVGIEADMAGTEADMTATEVAT